MAESPDWSARHHGIDPAAVPLLQPWLRFTDAIARPLAAVRVPAWVLTAAGVVFAVDSVLLAVPAPWAAGSLVLAAVLCDGLDGAVAARSGRVTRLGGRLDHWADRVSDCAFAAVLWRCGAPWWLAGAAAALSLAHEGIRTWRGGLLLARITVAERPTRAICTVLAAGSAGVSDAHWPPTVCAAVWVAAALIGLGQLAATQDR